MTTRDDLIVICLFHKFFQQHRGDDGGHNDDQYDRGKQLAAEQPHVVALLGDDQGDFSSGNHADSHIERFPVAVFAKPCPQTAAEDLCQYGDDQDQQRKNQHGFCHSIEFCFDADACKENR